MANTSDIKRDAYMLHGRLARLGYDWWWHSFTGHDESGRERSFFIEFYVCNPALATTNHAPTFGQLPKNKSAGIRPSYMMVKVGAWGVHDGRGEDLPACQIHRFFNVRDCGIFPGTPFSLFGGDCSLSETHTRGTVEVSARDADAHTEWMSDAGNAYWDIKIQKLMACNLGYGTDTAARNSKLLEMYWHAEGMKTAYSGMIAFEGIEYTIDPKTCYGYADKNWGTNYTSPWLWLSSNDLTSEITGERLMDSAFDIGGGTPAISGVGLKGRVIGQFTHEGTDYEFNFSKFWTHAKTSFSFIEEESEVVWHVEQNSSDGRLIADIRCAREDMLFINYEAPDGSKCHNRLWNGGTGYGRVELFKKTKDGLYLVDIVKCGHVGCEYGVCDGK